jgi:hypothetical protein
MPKNTSRFAAESHLVAKANKDKAFRRRLIKNPKATIAKELKVKFEPGAKVTVIEETSKTWHLVIPLKPKNSAKKEPLVLVRNRGGIFYKAPQDVISIFAVRDKKELKKAALAWKAETPDVEGQGWWESPWNRPWAYPTCGIRG